jgi:hypothetical protein
MEVFAILVNSSVYSNEIGSHYRWCNRIELFIDYGTEFDQQRGKLSYFFLKMRQTQQQLYR